MFTFRYCRNSKSQISPKKYILLKGRGIFGTGFYTKNQNILRPKYSPPFKRIYALGDILAGGYFGLGDILVGGIFWPEDILAGGYFDQGDILV